MSAKPRQYRAGFLARRSFVNIRGNATLFVSFGPESGGLWPFLCKKSCVIPIAIFRPLPSSITGLHLSRTRWHQPALLVSIMALHLRCSATPLASARGTGTKRPLTPSAMGIQPGFAGEPKGGLCSIDPGRDHILRIRSISPPTKADDPAAPHIELNRIKFISLSDPSLSASISRRIISQPITSSPVMR
jgi:hypothetical protein